MARRDIEGSYARLRGLKDSTITGQPFLSRGFGQDYELVLGTLRTTVEDQFEGFDLGPYCFWDQNRNDTTYDRAALLSKVNQLISYLEMVHRASDRIVEIGSVFNLIQDEELKSWCSDLLSARDHFDRVINQATLVLEERIRKMLSEFEALFGLALISKAMNAEISKSRVFGRSKRARGLCEFG
ncbi:MAG: hypothetical protein ABJA10_00990 [Aestuariivirga sp.]